MQASSPAIDFRLEANPPLTRDASLPQVWRRGSRAQRTRIFSQALRSRFARGSPILLKKACLFSCPPDANGLSLTAAATLKVASCMTLGCRNEDGTSGTLCRPDWATRGTPAEICRGRSSRGGADTAGPVQPPWALELPFAPTDGMCCPHRQGFYDQRSASQLAEPGDELTKRPHADQG